MRDDEKTLGQKLRELREDYDLSQNQIAKALNIDRSTYTNYELDKTRPNLETLVKLAHIFRTPPESLLPLGAAESSSRLGDNSHSGNMVKSLTKAERGLIAAYRGQSEEKQRQIRDFIANITKS